jgi:hypothetical protein
MGGAAFVEGKTPLSHFPESRVLIIMTGGTICMQPSEDGLVPMTGFLKNAMAPRPSFNDHSAPSGMLTGTVALRFRQSGSVRRDVLRTGRLVGNWVPRSFLLDCHMWLFAFLTYTS